MWREASHEVNSHRVRGQRLVKEISGHLARRVHLLRRGGQRSLWHGYDVTIGTNSPGKREEPRTKARGKVTVGSFEDAARFGDTVVLATKGSAAEAAVKAAGVSHLRGKTVIDTTNPIADAPPVNGVFQVFTAQNDSLMERLQRLDPDAHFVKAFSSMGTR